jgi:putative endopeptidase
MFHPTLLLRAVCASCLLTATLHSHALDLSGRDEGVSACTDFYRYINGAWEARTQIPADRARIGSFDVLRIANDKLLEQALAELAANPPLQDSPGLKLVATAYQSAMNTEAIEAAGLQPLAPLLEKISALKPSPQLSAQLSSLMAELARVRVAAPFEVFVQPDLKDVRRHAFSLWQGGLGLPDRDDYTRTDANAKRLMAAYRQHATTLLKLASLPHDDAAINNLIAFEAKLAAASMTPVQRRDPQATYNRMPLATLNEKAPGMAWNTYTATYLGEEEKRTSTREIVVGQPEFARTVAALMQEAPLAQWQLYLQVRLLDAYALRLPQAFVQSHFEYHQKAVRGLQSEPPRAERVVLDLGGPTGGNPMGPALGELFVLKAFSPRAQARADAMIEDIRAAMRERIHNLPWMSAPTKQKALEKLAAMKPLIGKPEKPTLYKGLTLRENDYAGNMLRIHAWEAGERAQRLDQPVDRARWETSAYVVNAFAGSQNRIVFPAGILQPPFFDENADDAVNFGAIGMVIGHEITHHFDDRGRQFDAAGNIKDWWTQQDATAYGERAQRVAGLYSTYEPVPGEFINGKQMLGENISDLGGIHIAYAGLQRALQRKRDQGQATPSVDGLTPSQRFFAANAVVWRGKQRTEALINQLRTGQHSPGPFRVRGPMSNMPQFAQAFGCKAGDAMVAGEPIMVW